MDELAILEQGILRAVDAGQWEDALDLAANRDGWLREFATHASSEQLMSVSRRDAEMRAVVVRARDEQQQHLASFRQSLVAARAYSNV